MSLEPCSLLGLATLGDSVFSLHKGPGDSLHFSTVLNFLFSMSHFFLFLGLLHNFIEGHPPIAS